MDLRVSFNRAARKGLELVTGTRINAGEANEINAIDVNVANANDIEVAVSGEGIATAANQRIVANTTEYTQAALVANVLTIASSKGLYLKNDGTSDFTITIGSLTFTVKPGEVRCIETSAAFTAVTFSAGATFRAFGVTRAA